MSYFYVDSTIGTRTTGGGTTKQTGTFDVLGAANLYATRSLAIADGLVDGDIMVCAQRHAETTASTITVNFPRNVTTVVAENANCDVYVKSTSSNEHTTGYYNSYGGRSNYGFWTKAERGINHKNDNNSFWDEDCTYEVTGSGDRCCYFSSAGGSAHLIRPTFKGVSGSIPFRILGGSVVNIVGGVVEAGPTVLLSAGFAAGGGSFCARGLDISNVTGTVVNGVGGAATSDDAIDVRLYSCPTAASFNWTNEDFKNLNQRLRATNCANTTALEEYQYYEQARGGYAESQDDAGIYRSETTPYPSGTKTSIHILTNADASIPMPFWFDLPTRHAKLSSTASDKLRYYLCSTIALDDTDIGIELTYKDEVDTHKLNFVSTREPNKLILASAGTALTTDSGSTWEDNGVDLTGYNEYYIDIPTSGDKGADCVPAARIFASLPSTSFYLDPIPDVVAG